MKNRKIARFTLAGMLALSALAFVGASPADAVGATGTLVDNGNGTVSGTYTGASNAWGLFLWPAPATCPPTGPATPLGDALYGAGSFSYSSMPLTVAVDTQVAVMATQSLVPLPAGLYQFCLVTTNGIASELLVSLEARIGDSPPTTTTAAPTTNTVVEEPAAPAYTG